MHPAHHAQKTPDKPAIIMASTGETLTYLQLEERSNQGAQLFRQLGLKPGDGIAIFMETTSAFSKSAGPRSALGSITPASPRA